MSKWRVVMSYGQHLIAAPGCHPFRWGGRWAFVHHRPGCESFSCGRRADTLTEALQFVDVEAFLQGANMEVSA